MILTIPVTIIVIIGKPIQITKLNDGIESFNWKRAIVIKRKRIETGNASVSESTVGTFISGLDITNKL